MNASLHKYLAVEDGAPLFNAFKARPMQHPHSSAPPPVPADDMLNIFAELHLMPRRLKSSAYIHVPFCETHCLYCGFYRKKYKSEYSRIYVDALIKDLQLYAGSKGQDNGAIHAVYFGGGTPTALEANDLYRALKAVRQYLPLANDCEITVEGRVYNFGQKKMEACLEGGANRFSLGVQTFDTDLRRSMGRRAAKDEIIESLLQLKSYDAASVVIDLIYGFPGQSLAMWNADVKAYLELCLDGVDFYQLKVFPGTPLFKAIEHNKLSAGANVEGRAQMYADGMSVMHDAHYHRLSVNHWGRTTRERNIYNHLAKGDYYCLGFGPGAGGNLHGYSYFTQPNFDTWLSSIHEGIKPLSMLSKHPAHSKLTRTISSHLDLCAINLHNIGDTFSCALPEMLEPIYEQWARARLLVKNGDWYELTTAGQFWQPTMAQLTINYLQNTQLRT